MRLWSSFAPRIINLIRARSRTAEDQRPFDAAVVIPTVLRESLLPAVRSVFSQRSVNRVQILIGVDVALGDRSVLDIIARDCPPNMTVMVFDPGYSTSARHGGLYSNRFSGALRTILSYTANSRYLAYLDDDNWFAPNHLSSLLATISGYDWAYSQRWMVDSRSRQPMYVDTTESVGPGRGLWGAPENGGGYVDTGTLMIDKLRCHTVLPYWSIGPLSNGGGEDRLVFRALATDFVGRGSNLATSYYVVSETDDMHPHRVREALRAGYQVTEAPSPPQSLRLDSLGD